MDAKDLDEDELEDLYSWYCHIIPSMAESILYWIKIEIIAGDATEKDWLCHLGAHTGYSRIDLREATLVEIAESCADKARAHAILDRYLGTSDKEKKMASEALRQLSILPSYADWKSHYKVFDQYWLRFLDVFNVDPGSICEEFTLDDLKDESVVWAKESSLENIPGLPAEEFSSQPTNAQLRSALMKLCDVCLETVPDPSKGFIPLGNRATLQRRV